MFQAETLSPVRVRGHISGCFRLIFDLVWSPEKVENYEWARTVSQRSHKRPHPYLRII